MPWCQPSSAWVLTPRIIEGILYPYSMARKKSSYRTMKKIEPAEMDVLVRLPNLITGAERPTIDISQCASLLNRRFYRQGINWAVSGFTLHTIGTNLGTVTISKLPSTWVMSNAWEKGFRAWQKMNNEALAETESVRPRFLDYKIYANDAHHTLGFAENLLPFVFQSSGATDTATPGEWQSSKMTVPFGPASPGNVSDYEIIAVGQNYPGVSAATGINAVSLIEGYANSRGLPNVLDPNAPDDALDADGSTPENWLAATFNEGTEQTTEILESMVGPLAENNIAPYPFENDGVHADTMYPNGETQMNGLVFHDRMSSTSTTISGKLHARGGSFPCGLIQLNYAPEMAQSILQIHLVPGEHRGYLCEPMTEM